jgi:hypothetical protein
MRILHLIDHMGLGGAQNLILDLVETRSSKIDAAVWPLSGQVPFSAAKRLESADVPIRNLGLSEFNPLGWLKLRALLKEQNPDLLHTHLQFSSTFGIAAALSLGKDCPRLVNHVHNDPFLHYTHWQRVGSRLVAPFVDAQITSSSSLQKKMVQLLGKRARRIESVTPGINLKRLNKVSMEPKHMDHFRGGAARCRNGGPAHKTKGLARPSEATRLYWRRNLPPGFDCRRWTLAPLLSGRLRQDSHAVAFLGIRAIWCLFSGDGCFSASIRA